MTTGGQSGPSRVPSWDIMQRMTDKTTNKSSATLIIVIGAIVGIAVGLLFGQKLWQGFQGPQPAALPAGLEASVLPEGRQLVPFTLHDHNGQAFNLERFKGHWSFLFFGYTNCPDICPITLKVMQKVWKDLASQPTSDSEAQMIFVSVDPDRDSLEKLKAYVNYFDPAFIGVTGQANQIDILSRQLGILYGFEDPEQGSKDYLVSHSASIVLVDPQARMRAVFTPPLDAAGITRSFLKIRDFYQE